ncbi:GNAT family N-acetyltransferase [Longirhabdus pacifica]|uniref:GNAT family N-acetyltransferase n=1 Tax=Longirhabdus pacifica TaxID=2305227 RepID=UPI0010090A9B|nr:GNAT family protein [Longirhabdus pacifica]
MGVNISELRGQTVMLRTMQPTDLDALYAISTEEIWQYTPMRVKHKEDMKCWMEYVLNEQKKGMQHPFVILDTHNNIVGSTSLLDIQPAHRKIEIGWTWLARDVWKTRINSECKYVLLSYCFELWEAARVQLKTDTRNKRSQRAIERIGAKQEGTLRQDRILCDGHIRDTVYYSILREEWPSIKRHLKMSLGLK